MFPGYRDTTFPPHPRTIRGNGLGPRLALYLGVFDWKVQRFCWPKGTSLECAESIYVKTTGAACVSEELCR